MIQSSVYSIKMVASVFGGIVVKKHGLHAFVIVTGLSPSMKYGPSLMWIMFGCGPDLGVHQISRQQKTSGPWLLSNWLVTIRESLLLRNCGIVLKLHLICNCTCHPISVCLNAQAYKCYYYCQSWLFWVLISQDL
ncbi:hypothetical protein TNCV_4027251 [Trichonephila clavipes]|nr:hypothetical protein TNCV_4027251 [Trichonephila clavipes]